MADLLAANVVEIVASLPCYLEENVDQQRGDGVFEASLAGLRRLNAPGYGLPDSSRILNLVYNRTAGQGSCGGALDSHSPQEETCTNS